jgi:hypothetical protein
MSQGRQLLPPKEQAILDSIENHKALIAIVFDLSYDGNYGYGWRVVDYSIIDKHYLDQIADPNDLHKRPSRYVDLLNYYSSIPAYDFPMISLTPTTPISADAIQKAQENRSPIAIKRGDDQYSLYQFDYYREPQWQETPLTNLRDDEKDLLKRFAFDGRVIKQEEGLPYTGDPDVISLYQLMMEHHVYLPAVINKMNMQTREVQKHHPGQDRFTIHKGQKYIFTPKTSTSLIPPNPIWMELFHGDYGIGFLWHINDCNLKNEKYVFPVNAGTDGCDWLDLNSGYGFDYNTGNIRYITAEEKIAHLNEYIDKYMPLATVESLQKRNLAAIETKTPIPWNELVVGLPAGLQKEAPDRNIRSVFATQDVRIARLRALRAMWHVKEKHGLSEDLPLFILEPKYAIDPADPYPDPRPQRPGVFRFYLLEEQKADLLAEAADQQVTQVAADVIKNQRALALPVSDKSIVDHYFEQPQKTSLLPTEPQWMKLSNDGQPVVGLLWDINACDLDDAARASIDGLKEKNNEAVQKQEIIDANTLPAGLPKGRIDGVYCYYDQDGDLLDTRLKAIELAQYVKEKLKLTTNVPIFWIYPREQCDIYNDINQLIDQTEAKERELQALRHTAKMPTANPFTKQRNNNLPHRLFTRPATAPAPKAKQQTEDQDWVVVNKEETKVEETNTASSGSRFRRFW